MLPAARVRAGPRGGHRRGITDVFGPIRVGVRVQHADLRRGGIGHGGINGVGHRRAPHRGETIPSSGPLASESRTEGIPMWKDLAALTPPLVVAVAFSALVFSVLRRELAKRHHRDDGQNGHPDP